LGEPALIAEVVERGSRAAPVLSEGIRPDGTQVYLYASAEVDSNMAGERLAQYVDRNGSPGIRISAGRAEIAPGAALRMGGPDMQTAGGSWWYLRGPHHRKSHMASLFDRQTFPITCSQNHTTEFTPPQLRESLMPRCKICGEDISGECAKTLQIIGACELAAEAELAKAKGGG
jgi:hypothetical protein